jgi:hypothetical protein
MEDSTNEVMATITRQKQRLLALLVKQDQLTAELVQLEKKYEAGTVTQAALDRRLAVLIPRQQRQQQEIAAVLAEIERLRQRIFRETGLLLPPIG